MEVKLIYINCSETYSKKDLSDLYYYVTCTRSSISQLMTFVEDEYKDGTRDKYDDIEFSSAFIILTDDLKSSQELSTMNPEQLAEIHHANKYGKDIYIGYKTESGLITINEAYIKNERLLVCIPNTFEKYREQTHRSIFVPPHSAE